MFLLYAKVSKFIKDYRNILKLICRPLAFTSYKALEVWNYLKGIKFRGYLISRLEKNYILRVFNFVIWWLQNILRVFNFAIKGTLSSLKQFFAFESPIKNTKIAFYFTLKAFFVLEIFKFLSWIFVCEGKRLD